ncbi:MAG: DEAD/DEAH box helicase, partial [Campylobacterales bacterium]|nr:DEAD/DEAH box helicase [Campylobacterales bacterium]
MTHRSAISPEDADKFRRLGVGSVTELSLIIPSAFEDRRLSTELLHNAPCVIDATVERVVRTPKTVKITFFSHNLNEIVEGVIFHPKPYMMHAFAQGSRGFFGGKAQWEQGRWTMLQPAKLSQTGSIVPVYKTPLRADVMRRLVEKYVSVENLIDDGLPENVSRQIYLLHFPDAPRALGETEFRALKFAELYDYMRRLRLKRRYHPTRYRAQGDVEAWMRTLPFEMTGDQKKAIAQIEHDLKGPNATRRMIVGDVGSGKTMVILASAVLMRPYRSILMAPTTILAAQLYEEAQKYLHRLKIALVTNATKKEPLDGYDFIIGTHALLYRDLP